MHNSLVHDFVNPIHFYDIFLITTDVSLFLIFMCEGEEDDIRLLVFTHCVLLILDLGICSPPPAPAHRGLSTLADRDTAHFHLTWARSLRTHFQVVSQVP